MHKGHWAVSIDLKDAYFHIPIHVRSRRLLQFAVATNDELRVFQFRALPFGLTSSPRVFTKVILPVGHHAHLHAVCLLQYLDDWLLRSPNKLLLAQQTSWLLDIIRRVGFVLNVPKSQLVPTQRLIHIGVEYHLDLGLMFPPMNRIQKFKDRIATLLSVSVTRAYFFLSLLGLLSSATDAIPLGRLHLRPQQLYLLAHWAPVSRNLKALIPVRHELLDHHLRWWLNRKCTRAGVLLDVPEARARLFTDASESGWGAHLDDHQTSGSWSTREATLHINHFKMLAVLFALRAFRVQLTGLTVQLMSDNASMVSYIRNQGGTVSVPLYHLTREVLLLARDAQITLLAKHIPGDRNALADLLSRMNKIVHTEWTLNQSVFKARTLNQSVFTWDTPNLDLFATHLNNRRPVSVSPMADPLAVDVDAMSMSLKGMYAYAFPPFVMLGQVLEKVLKDHPCEMILVAPKWPNQSWYARLFDLLVDFPLVLPLREDLLFQPHNHQRHRSLPAVCLHAWRLSSDPLQRERFSQAAVDQISRGRRQSSRAVYDSKWRIFSGWCAGQSVDPFQVTIPQVADFFVFLFQVKHLNPWTIKGYRSAISSKISSCGSRTELSYSQELSSLIRSFQLERPLQRKVAPPPPWNLSLVVQALTKPPFEPIAKCELKFLTLKSVFLVALASGRRRSELHALCFDSHHFRQNQDQSMVTLYPDLEFVAKTQALYAVAEPIKLRAFTSVGSYALSGPCSNIARLLTTPECRKGRKKLFISYKPAKSDEIKRATISSWIVKLIRLVYESEGSDPRTLELHKVSARGSRLVGFHQCFSWHDPRHSLTIMHVEVTEHILGLLPPRHIHFWMTFLSCPARWLARRIVIVACQAPPPNILVLLGTPVCVEIGFSGLIVCTTCCCCYFLLFPFIKRVSLSFLSGNSWADDYGYHEVQSHDCLGFSLRN